MLGAMIGRDDRDSTSIGIPAGIEVPSREDLEGLRIGVPRELSSDAEGIEPGVSETFERNIELCRELGAEVAETTLPNARHGISAYYVLAPAEASANLARYDGVRFGLREEADSLDEMYELTRAAGFGPEVKRRIMLGTYALSSGFYDAYYWSAQKVRTLIAQDFADRLRGLRPADHADVADGGLRARCARRGSALDVHVRLLHGADVAGRHPGDLDPLRPRRAGRRRPRPAQLPVGLQIAGPAFSESLIFDAAHAIEKARRLRPQAEAPGGAAA